MDNEDLFKFMEKMYNEMNNKFGEVNNRFSDMDKKFESMHADQVEMKKDIKQIGAKIDGEITDKLKILAEEQSIMRKDILDIKDQQKADEQILLDLKLSTDILNSKRKKQKNNIIEIKR